MKLPLFERDCQGCTACCTVKEVYEIDKPPGQKCLHQKDFSCGIYRERPKSCADYVCMWKMQMLPENYKPDLCGFVIDWSPSMFSRKEGAKDIVIYEVWNGALNEKLVAGLLPHLERFIRNVAGAIEFAAILIFPLGTMFPVGTPQEFIHGPTDSGLIFAQATGKAAA